MAYRVITFLVGTAEIFVFFAVAFFSWRIYRYNRLAKGWLAVTAAFALMGVKQLVPLMILSGYIPKLDGTLWELSRIYFPGMISVLLLFGIWSMWKQFETFSIVEKNVAKKVADISKRKVKEIKKRE